MEGAKAGEAAHAAACLVLLLDVMFQGLDEVIQVVVDKVGVELLEAE